MRHRIAWRLLGRLIFASVPALVLADAVRANQPAAIERVVLMDEIGMTIHRPPGEGPFPAVILAHGCGGLTAGVQAGLEAHAGFFVDNGFAAVILDSFGLRGKEGGKVCASLEELARARYYRQKDALRARRFLAMKAYIDPARISFMGQSNGGSVALLLAQSNAGVEVPEQDRFHAVIAYYPWCGALQNPPKLMSPLLVLGAGEDDWVSPKVCKEREQDAQDAAMKVIVYEGTLHSFDLPIAAQTYSGHRVGGDPEATSDSRIQMLQFLEAAD